MRLAALLLTSALGLTLAACGDVELPRYKGGKADEVSRLKVVTQLECPESQGDLTRVRVEANGSCVYAGPKGSEVTLRLVPTTKGETGEALKSLDDEIRTLMPRAAAVAAAEDAGESASAAMEISAKAGAEASAGTAEAAAEAGAAKEEDVNVRLPGITIQTKGDAATVRMPGIHIEADEKNGKGDSAKVNISLGKKSVVVNARDESSEIRTVHEGADVHTAYLLVDERSNPSGFQLAGYEAAGPKDGPLVVAVVKAKAAEGDKEEAFKDAKRLIERNVGKLR